MPDARPEQRPPDECVQEEVRRQASADPVDEDTAREGLELELMEHDESDEGEHIGEHVE